MCHTSHITVAFASVTFTVRVCAVVVLPTERRHVHAGKGGQIHPFIHAAIHPSLYPCLMQPDASGAAEQWPVGLATHNDSRRNNARWWRRLRASAR